MAAMDAEVVPFEQPAQLGGTGAAPMEGLVKEEQEHPTGLRRWGRGRWRNDFTYYAFQEYMAFVVAEGLDKEERWAGSDVHAIALNLWKRSKDKEDDERETRVWAQKVQEKIGSLPHVAVEELAGGAEGILLQLVQGEDPKYAWAAGTTLRSRKNCKLDMWGTDGPESLFGLEVIRRSPTLQVHLRSFTGQKLESRGGLLGFWGSAVSEAQDGGDGIQVLELLPRDAPVPVVIMATKGGRVVGTFTPRRLISIDHHPVAGGPLPGPGLQARLVSAALRLSEGEPTFLGRRRHLQDSNCTYYSFPEMVLHFQRLYQLQEGPALELARSIWLHACVPEPEPSWSLLPRAHHIDDVLM